MIHFWKFLAGAFPFGFFATNFNWGDQQGGSGPVQGSAQYEEEQFLHRVFLWVAFAFIFWLLIAWVLIENNSNISITKKTCLLNYMNVIYKKTLKKEIDDIFSTEKLWLIFNPLFLESGVLC